MVPSRKASSIAWLTSERSKVSISRSTCTYSRLPCFFKPGFEQTPQFGEAARQLPTDKWGSLIQSPRLLFEQRQIVQRIDNRLAFIAARVSCDDLAGAGNHHFMHKTLHQNLTVAVLGWH